LTEDSGWRHVGPHGALPGFDHGGPRIVIDPIDGTRNLMTDLRSAWTVVGLAGAGAEQPTMKDVELGIVSEIPDSRAARYRVFAAERGRGCQFAERALDDPSAAFVPWQVDADDRADFGYFVFFGYSPDLRPFVTQRAARFFEALASEESADTRHCFDDQYISSGGLLALLTLGSHRLVVELRALIAEREGRPFVSAKPYDIAGAVLCAQEAGCVVTKLDGSALDFPLDVVTGVDFVGFANAATAERLRPHLRHALA